MNIPASHTQFQLARQAIDLLFPLHVVVDEAGLIVNLGPTLARILGTERLGCPFFDMFRIVKPGGIDNAAALRAAQGKKLAAHATGIGGQALDLRATAVPMQAGEDRLLVDFTISRFFSEIIRRYDLSSYDFRPNDVSIDLFYSLEAQRTVLEDSQKLARDLSAAKEAAEKQAYLDIVTNIANRRALQQRLSDLIGAGQSAQTHALIQIDLDKFKSINDSFGHAAGDFILQHTANAISAAAGARDLAARLGGDEFALLLDAPGARADVLSRAGRLLHDITRPVRFGTNTFSVGASIGVMLFSPREIPSPDRVLLNADIALYDAKAKGGGVSLLTPALLRDWEAKAALTDEIAAGIERAEFVPYFQPQIRASTGAVHGVEVLARWHHPSKGTLLPFRFLDAAARAGIETRIDGQIRRRAAAHFAAWRRAGLEIGSLSFNLTGANLRSEDFTPTFLELLEAEDLPPDCVHLELLEAILFDSGDQLLLSRCKALCAAGFKLALDDFGTGHASISTLIDVPITTVKIDRSFISGMDQNSKLRRVTQSILAMTQGIGLSALAEGVETRAELEVLRASGCDLFQGFYFARPMPAADIPGWIAAHSAGRGRAAHES